MSRGGFTLVEVLIAVVICLVLAGIAFGLLGFVDAERVRSTKNRLDALGFEVRKHSSLKGWPPAKLEDLAAAVDQPGWMQGGKFVDIWDQPIQYSVEGKKFRLWSCGRDGVPGTADDLEYLKK